MEVGRLWQQKASERKNMARWQILIWIDLVESESYGIPENVLHGVARVAEEALLT